MKWFKCCHCKCDFPEDNFYRDKSKPSGRKPRCKSCEKEYLNKDRRREYEKKYRESMPEKRRTILRRWYENNKEHFYEVQQKYRGTDGFKLNHRHHGAVRRTRLKNNKYEKIDLKSIYEKHPFCFYCGMELKIEDVEFDHFSPIARGGSHVADNIRVSCMPCNRRKGAMAYQMV
jgi:5-methylcytosine-specific restriction endonuclease McrA